MMIIYIEHLYKLYMYTVYWLGYLGEGLGLTGLLFFDWTTLNYFVQINNQFMQKEIKSSILSLYKLQYFKHSAVDVTLQYLDMLSFMIS